MYGHTIIEELNLRPQQGRRYYIWYWTEGYLRRKNVSPATIGILKRLYRAAKFVMNMRNSGAITPEELEADPSSLPLTAKMKKDNQEMAYLLFLIIRAKANDGKIDTEEWAMLKQRAWKHIQEHAGPEIMATIEKRLIGE